MSSQWMHWWIAPPANLRVVAERLEYLPGYHVTLLVVDAVEVEGQREGEDEVGVAHGVTDQLLGDSMNNV